MIGNKAILDSNVIIDAVRKLIDIEIADLTVGYRKIKKIKVPDAIILATARKLNAILLTSNIVDFKNVDDLVIILQPEKLV